MLLVGAWSIPWLLLDLWLSAVLLFANVALVPE